MPACARREFAYIIAVNEVAGTYWYRMSAGNLNEYDAVRGSLIVHSEGARCWGID